MEVLAEVGEEVVEEVVDSIAVARLYGEPLFDLPHDLYIPPDALDQIIAHTKLLGPGETDTIEFDAPGPGSYPFLCTFPGHVALMSGTLVVQ